MNCAGVKKHPGIRGGRMISPRGYKTVKKEI